MPRIAITQMSCGQIKHADKHRDKHVRFISLTDNLVDCFHDTGRIAIVVSA